jgi:membrane-bound ClpP family serine protease
MPATADLQLGDPLIFKLLCGYLRPDILPDAILDLSLYKAALIVLGAAAIVIPLFHRLRVSSVLGLVLSVVGFLASISVFFEALTTATPPGWGSLMCALFLFCGVQLLTVGLVGEYVGRIYLTANRRPQSVVRAVERRDDAQ